MGTSGPPGSEGGSKVPLVLGVALALVVMAIGGAVLLLMNGGDDGGNDDEATETTETSVSDSSDEFEDFSDDFSDDSRVDDADADGVPDAQDPDDDGDGVPDAQDPDDDGNGVPDDQEPGDGDGGGEPGDEDPGDDPGDDEPGDDEPATDLDLLRNDPRPAVDAWIDVVGDGAKAIEVVLYPEYGFADIRDPDQPNRLLEFGWRGGAVQGPEPTEPFPGTDLNAESFRMTAVNWDALPRLVANAPERAGLAQGEVTHVIVTSDLPFSSRFLFRIYVTAPNGSDYVVATIDGRPAER